MIETKKPTTTRGVIREAGNGLPGEGDVVMASEGTLYQVGRSLGPIETHGPGRGNTERVELEVIGTGADNPELCCNNQGTRTSARASSATPASSPVGDRDPSRKVGTLAAQKRSDRSHVETIMKTNTDRAASGAPFAAPENGAAADGPPSAPAEPTEAIRRPTSPHNDGGHEEGLHAVGVGRRRHLARRPGKAHRPDPLRAGRRSDEAREAPQAGQAAQRAQLPLRVEGGAPAVMGVPAALCSSPEPRASDSAPIQPPTLKRLVHSSPDPHCDRSTGTQNL